MNKYIQYIRRIIIIALTVTFTGGLAFGAPDKDKTKFRRTADPAAGQYIVVFISNVAAKDVATLADNLAQAHGGVILHKYQSALRGFSVRLTEKQALAMSQNPLVEFIEEDGVATANDVQYSPPWGLDRVDQRDLPLSGSFDNRGLNGLGVTVYVLDTGIRTSHQEFGGRAYVGADFIGDGLNGQDGYGHGTHVAGTIGGQTFGIAKSVPLCAVRVLDSSGSGTWSQVIAGIDWVAANHSGASVANMSLGGGAADSLDQAVRNSISSGVTYVVAAGNSYSDASYYSPARVTEAITVSATNSSDTRADFANYGTTVDLFAPGVDVLSAWIGGDTETNTISGTSMATPHVAGLAALYLQSHPEASPATVESALIYACSTDRVANPGSGSPNRLAFLDDSSSLPGPDPGPIYRIMNVNSGLALEVEYDSPNAGARIDQWPYVGSTSQQWRLEAVGGGAYKIVNVNSGLVLDVENDSLNAGARILQWHYVGISSQHWILTDIGGGAQVISNVNSGLVLDVENDSLDPQAYIDQWPYVGLTSQQWLLEQVN